MDSRFQQTEYIREGPLSAPRHCPHSEGDLYLPLSCSLPERTGSLRIPFCLLLSYPFLSKRKKRIQQAPTNLFFFATLHSTDDTLQALNLGFYTGIAESKARQRNILKVPAQLGRYQ